MNIKCESNTVKDGIYGNTAVDGTPVKAGKIYDLIKKALGLFEKLIDKLDKLGEAGDRKGGELYVDFLMSSAEDAESLGDNSDKWPESDTVRVKVQFTGGKKGEYDIVNVYMKVKDQPDSKGYVRKNITVEYSDPTDAKKSTEELFEVVGEVLNKDAITQLFRDRSALDVGDLKAIKSSPVNSSIKVTLQKIVADDEMDIELIAVDSPFNVKRTNDVIDRVTDSPEFVDSLPENEPASFDIDPDELSVLSMNDDLCVDMSCCILKILGALYRLYFDSMYVTWNATGQNYQSVVALADTYIWTTKGLIDQLSVEHFKQFGYAPHPLMFCGDMPYDDLDKTSVEILQSDMQDIVDIIDLYYCNFDGILQDCLIQVKDMFDNEINYTLERFNG